jgi:hypothetical protein
VKHRHGLALLSCLILLAGCGESEDAAQKGAAMLRAYYSQKPLDFGWEVTRIERVADGELRIDVLVNDENVVNQIKIRSRMDQMSIARLACPDAEHPFLKSLNHDLKMNIALNTRDVVIVRSACRH